MVSRDDDVDVVKCTTCVDGGSGSADEMISVSESIRSVVV